MAVGVKFTLMDGEGSGLSFACHGGEVFRS